VGHGVSDELIAEVRAAIDIVMAQPLDHKQGWTVADPAANRGYRGRGSEALSYSLGAESPPDLFESFNVGHDSRTGHRLFGDTPWPGLDGFDVPVRRYLDEMVRLCVELDDVIESALGVADLARRSDHGPDTMALIRYAWHPDEDDAAPAQQRMGAHSDYTSYTVLCAERVQGLEILLDDTWEPVQPDPGALLLNVGDLLAIWSNDRWLSTIHRVPLLVENSPLRRSMAYFHYPNLDVAVAPLDGDESTYSPVVVAEHLEARLVGPKQHTASEGTSTLGDRQI
jgi:isopenicillin N synthase-like dioxygenase